MRKLLFTILLVSSLLVLGCAQGTYETDEQGEVIAPSTIDEDDWETSEDGAIQLAVVVPSKMFSDGDDVPARIGIKTEKNVRLKYLLFGNDVRGNTVFSYPFPEKMIMAGESHEFTPTANLLESDSAHKYYFKALVLDINEDELYFAKDTPVGVR